MDFGLTDEQLQMQSEMGRALEARFSLARVKNITQAESETPAEICEDVSSLGISGLLIEERYGGIGRGLLEAVVVGEQLGRYVVPAPYVASVVMSAIGITGAGSPEQKRELLPLLAEGRLMAAVGISEFASGARGGVPLTFRNGALSGSTIFVLDSGSADLFLLVGGEQRLYLVRRETPGLKLTKLDTIDATRTVCKLDLENAECEHLPHDNARVAARMRDAGRVVLAADTLGAATRMIEKAVEYAGQRRQFGRVIGSFQAVKHICAEMAAELEPARALIWYAAYAQDENREDAMLTALHAKAYAADAGRFVARKATEVHGGIGITDELGLHLWFKRIGWNFQVLGAPSRLREEAAMLQGLV